MRSEVINCDVCGITKGPGNKWLMGWEIGHGYALGDWNDEWETTRIVTEVNHLCSEACALKKQAKYLRRVA